MGIYTNIHIQIRLMVQQLDSFDTIKILNLIVFLLFIKFIIIQFS